MITDQFGIHMAVVNYSGLFTASHCKEQDEDAYEDDIDEAADNDKRRKSSNIEYRPFDEWKGTKPWNHELKNGESVECLAIGSGWCCALTNFNYLRVFSHDGIQKHMMC